MHRRVPIRASLTDHGTGGTVATEEILDKGDKKMLKFGRRFWIAAVFFVLVMVFAGWSMRDMQTQHTLTAAESSLLQETIGCPGKSRACLIKGNDGGRLLPFVSAVSLILREGIIVIVDGPCNSSCEMLMEWISTNACMTNNASFGFHQMFNDETHEFRPVHHTYLIQQWIDKKGGEPASRAVKDLLVMPSADIFATQIWRHCEVEGGDLVFP